MSKVEEHEIGTIYTEIKNEKSLIFKELLPKCEICQDIVILPVYFGHCEHQTLICLECMRTGLELKKPFRRRTRRYLKLSCGCEMDITRATSNTYIHCTTIDNILNKCVNPVCKNNCGKKFTTMNEYRRHLKTNDTSGCPESYIKCFLCKIWGKRSFIIGRHVHEKHLQMGCCYCRVQYNSLTEFNEHIKLKHKFN